MITRAQLEVYARFSGDVDGLLRTASAEDRALVAGEVWARIDALRDGLARTRAGVASPDYAARISRELAAELADPEARAILERLADADAHGRAAAG